MARIIHLSLDAGPLGPAPIRIGAHAWALARLLRAAVAVIHRRIAAPELDQLDSRLLRDLGLHREGATVWQHLDALAPLDRGRIIRTRYR
jgi:uncharacterized protein YjiS (DUF1127 family)